MYVLERSSADYKAVMCRRFDFKERILNTRMEFLVSLFLVLSILLIYGPVRNYEFIDFDDNIYITENPYVLSGLNKKSVQWAFKSAHAANWHPITWLSHLLDVTLYGTNPGAHHLTNLFFHVLNAVLLFFLLRRMTKDFWPSCMVSVLFALHPLNVESVAWIAQRKTVLCTFFGFMTLLGYIRYTEHPAVVRYLTTLVFFALGLMAKPMLVTLPFILLLLDYWPLRRFPIAKTGDYTDNRKQRSAPIKLILEKTPFLLLSAVSCILTYLVQKSGGAVRSMESIPFDHRIANAQVSYLSYMVKMILPHDLTGFYPHFGINLSLWKTLMSGMLLAGITIIAVYRTKRCPYFAVGWFWFVGTLIPVIGLVQVGSQTMADRYAYIPLIGLFIVFSWAVSDFLKSVPIRKPIFVLIVGLLVLICSAKTIHQVTTWKTDQQFYGHMLQVTSNNYLAHNGMGLVMSRQGKPERAIEHFKEAIRIKADYSDAYNNIGRELFRQGRIKDAMIQYKAAISHNPKSAKAHNNYAVALACIESPAEAVKHFQTAIAICPDYVSAHLNLAKLFVFENKMDMAVANFQRVLKLDPRNRDAANYLHQVTVVRKKSDD